MTEPNHTLRRLREAAASGRAPGESMGRQELADLVNSHVESATGRLGALDANYVGKLERGVITWPREHYRAGLRAVLGVGTDRALGFARPRPALVASIASGAAFDDAIEIALRTVLPSSAASVRTPTGQPADLRTLIEVLVPAPTGVRQEHVDAVMAAARMFTGVDHGHGGIDVATVAGVQLQHAARLLDLPCPDHLRSTLFTGVGWLSNVVAFAQFDAARQAPAAAAFTFALGCAEQAGNWHLRAKVLSGMAREAIWRGDPDAGLTYVELALVRADRLTWTERAMLFTARARALAVLGRVDETVRCVQAADEQFARRDPARDDDPPWMTYYDQAQHLGDTGHALFDLARRGNSHAEACRRLGAAYAMHSPGYVRSRGMSAAKLATLTFAVGDVEHGTQVAHRALDVLGDVHSARVRHLITDLDAAARDHAAAATDLRHRIAGALSPT